MPTPAGKPVVWVVGDAMLDVTVVAPAFRPSPEDPAAPVLTPSAGERVDAAGGAANLALNLHAQGCDVVLLAPWGESGWANARLQKLVVTGTNNGVKWPSYMPSGDPWLRAAGTTTKTRYVTSNRLVARVDDDFDSAPVFPPACVVGQKPAAVVLTDYGRGAVTADAAKEWAGFCRRFEVPMYADPKKGRVRTWSDVELAGLVLNWEEACEAAVETKMVYTPATLMRDDDEADRLADHILHSGSYSPTHVVVVKRGIYGSVYATADESALIPPILPRDHVMDRQGAGDTYLAAMVAGLVRGLEMPLACLLASSAAGVAVSRPGTAVVPLRDALGALKPFVSADTPVDQLKKMGYTIGYTNGCFDFHLHAGHLATLKHAASLCDFLFVGVDSDARVKRLKGDRRPIVSVADRVAQLEAVKGVHKAFAFDDHEQALRSVSPGVLVKGLDWKDKGVPEAELLKEWGGRLEFAPLVDAPHVTDRLKAMGIG